MMQTNIHAHNFCCSGTLSAMVKATSMCMVQQFLGHPLKHNVHWLHVGRARVKSRVRR